MFRGALTLLMRSVRADAQQRSAHALRIGSVLIILLLLIAAQAETANVGAPGLKFFRSVSYLAAALITLAGMGHFATSITEEKEEGTLSLLLLADISPLAILLGKSTNRVLSAWLLFVAQFPFALLALTLGGLTIAQIAASYLALAAYLFLVANLALLISVIARRTSESTALTAVAIVLMYAVPWWIWNATRSLIDHRRISKGGLWDELGSGVYWLSQETSILHQIRRIFDVNWAPQFLTLQVSWSLLLGIACFLLAWLRFRHLIWATDVTEPARGLTPQTGAAWRGLTTRPWRAALVWKDFHFLAGGPALTAAKCVLYPAAIGGCLYFRDWLQTVTTMEPWLFLRGSLGIILAVELLAYSSQLFHVEQKWGTLPTLLMLPRSAGQIGYAKALGCLLGSVPTLIALLVTLSLTDPAAGDGRWIALRKPAFSEVLGSVQLASMVIVLCELTVLCSLIVRWGALALAGAIFLLCAAVAAPILSGAVLAVQAGSQPEYAQLGPVLYATGIISCALQVEIARRLQLAAGS